MSFLSPLLLVALLASPAAPPPAPPRPVDADLQRLVRARLDAYARGDAAAWARFVTADCLCATATRAQLQQEIVSRPAGLKNWYDEITEWRQARHGEAMVVRYRVTEFSELGGHRLDQDQWRIETFVRRGREWLLASLAEMLIPSDPSIATIDPKILDAYVGRYEYGPGMVDTVARDGQRLFAQSTGQPPVELLPEDDTTFFAKGEAWRMIFRRDAVGRVTALVFRQNGQDLMATRLP